MNKGKLHYCLVIPESYVAPMKSTLVPKLELTAAVLSTKMSVLVKKELWFANIMEYYWTDSQIDIGYLRNTQKIQDI